jgi:hypothetical protein
MNKHTPGPWVADMDRTYGHPPSLTPNILICPVVLGRVMQFCVAKVSREGDEEAEANARLIAAAPDLLFQLLAASNYIDALGGDSKSYRAAIAKATGEQA